MCEQGRHGNEYKQEMDITNGNDRECTKVGVTEFTVDEKFRGRVILRLIMNIRRFFTTWV